MIQLIAGGVVIGPAGKIALVTKRNKKWSLPKGKIEKGETSLEAAQREIYEETGLTNIKYIREIGTYERFPTKNFTKRITLFLFTTEETELAPRDPVHPEARWVTLQEAITMLNDPQDRAFLESHAAIITARIMKIH